MNERRRHAIQNVKYRYVDDVNVIIDFAPKTEQHYSNIVVYGSNDYDECEHADLAICIDCPMDEARIRVLIDKLCSKADSVLITYKANVGARSLSDFFKAFHSNGFVVVERIDGYASDVDFFGLIKKLEPRSLRENIACTGCGACKNVCPTNCISMVLDDCGFYRPLVDETKCIGCNSCVKTCLSIGESNENAKPVFFAVKAEASVVRNSSSGGAFTLLSENIIDKGGVVFASRWVNGKLSISFTDSKSELSAYRYSKYLQTDTDLSFRECRRLLLEGRPVLFLACPCQIAGLKAFLKKQYDNLFVVDLLCNHCPSPGAVYKYLEENYGDTYETVNWREKGWRDFTPTIHLKDGSIVNTNDNDDLVQMFHSATEPCYTINFRCSHCKFSKIPRQGDITIGDFWGFKKVLTETNENDRVSIVLGNNEKGINLIKDSCSSATLFKETEYSKTVNTNAINRGSKLAVRPRFYDLIKKVSFSTASEYCKNRMYDVGLVLWWAENYGTNMTNYALYSFIKSLGKEVLLITHPNQKQSFFSKFSKPPCKPYEHSINEFGNNLSLLNDHCRMFILGSDQVFRSSFIKKFDYYTCLDWIRSDRYFISYAASFGVEPDSDPSHLSKVHYLLSRFDEISVREEDAIRIMKQYYSLDVPMVLDPVFLIDQTEYHNLFSKKHRLEDKEYVSAYILDESIRKNEILESISNSLKMKCVEILDNGKKSVYNSDNINVCYGATIEDWLSNISNSSFFITDSFHGLCFALIFKKQFAVVYEDAQWRGKGRITSLLSRLGLMNRWIKGTCDVEALIHNPICYEEIDPILDSIREYSIRWIENAINNADKKKKHIELYDIWRNKDTKIMETLDYLNKKVSALEETVNYLSPLIPKDIMDYVSAINSHDDVDSIMRSIVDTRMEMVIGISICEDANSIITHMDYFKSQSISLNMPKSGFAAIISTPSGKIKYSQGKTAFVELDCSDLKCRVNSSGYVIKTNRGVSEFFFGNKSAIIHKKGLNVVVYSLKYGIVVYSLNIDYEKGPIVEKNILFNSR